MKVKSLNEEYIGRKVRIIRSCDISHNNIDGFIYDETKNTFKILIKDVIKIIPKKGKLFDIENIGLIEGDKIIARSEDRIRKRD